jgi:hypothetical protein
MSDTAAERIRDFEFESLREQWAKRLAQPTRAITLTRTRLVREVWEGRAIDMEDAKGIIEEDEGLQTAYMGTRFYMAEEKVLWSEYVEKPQTTE